MRQLTSAIAEQSRVSRCMRLRIIIHMQVGYVGARYDGASSHLRSEACSASHFEPNVAVPGGSFEASTSTTDVHGTW